MATLIFLLSFFGLLALATVAMINIYNRKSVISIIKWMGYILGVYILLWLVFYTTRKYNPILMGKDICFDDWCATLTGAEKEVVKDSLIVTLHLKMTNKARGIDQKPSEPRVHIIDINGRYWGLSTSGQNEYEKRNGKQNGIEHRLRLNESLETTLIFILPQRETDLKVLIEEGPMITNMLFPSDQSIFVLK